MIDYHFASDIILQQCLYSIPEHNTEWPDFIKITQESYWVQRLNTNRQGKSGVGLTVKSSGWKILALCCCLFISFDSICPSQQFISYVGIGLPMLNQY